LADDVSGSVQEFRDGDEGRQNGQFDSVDVLAYQGRNHQAKGDWKQHTPVRLPPTEARTERVVHVALGDSLDPCAYDLGNECRQVEREDGDGRPVPGNSDAARKDRYAEEEPDKLDEYGQRAKQVHVRSGYAAKNP